MIDLKQNTLLREIPENLLIDPKVKALAEALQQSLDAMLDWSDKINYTMHLEKLDDEILDHILWERHITFKEGLSLITNRAHKIALIKNAIKIHRLKGTPAAVELVFCILNLDAVICEWFEYDGAPYTFRLAIDASHRGLSKSDYNALEMLLFEYKNVRSFLEKLTIHLNQHSSYDALASGNIGELVTVYPVIKYAIDWRMKQFHGAAVVIGEIVTVFPHAITEISNRSHASSTSVIYMAETMVVYPKIEENTEAVMKHKINTAITTAEDLSTFPRRSEG